jgi:threonine dehydrogenase-like Zn-dependent dehydrogenase
MRAVLVRFDRRVVEVGEWPAPVGEGVRLRILEVGICGTDREVAAFTYGRAPAGDGALVLGHECLARTEDGDLVVPLVRQPCPHARCRPCRAGRPDFCVTGDYTEHGIVGAHGFMAEEALIAPGSFVRVPEALRPVAVLTEPLTIAEKALHQVDTIQRRLPWSARHADGRDPTDEPAAERRAHRALVLGAGPVGLLGAMALRVRGYETAVYSREPATSERAHLAEAIGATYVAADETPVGGLPERLGPIDLVYEATGAAVVAFHALEVLGPNGVFVFTGVPGRKAPVELAAGTVMRRLVLANQVLVGTVNASRHAYAEAVRDLAEFSVRWPAALTKLIAARHAPEDVPRLLRERVPGVKHVVAFAP